MNQVRLLIAASTKEEAIQKARNKATKEIDGIRAFVVDYCWFSKDDNIWKVIARYG